MNVLIKSVCLENFKGAKKVTCNFDCKNVSVSGANATGKTTIFDAVWWTLFNKDSLGNEKFSIRPLDEDGQPIHNVEIKVTLILVVNGREIELCKTQKEKWVKRRGSEVAELQGNENMYAIDGYPKTERDYKLAIADLVSEDVFKMLTSTTYFTSLKWKEQRDILMRFVSNVNDYDLASSVERFAPLLQELMKAPSLDDIRAKFQKALTEWKRQQAEIPVRIDEIQKSKVDVDVAEFELGKKAIQELLKANREKQDDIETINKEFSERSLKIMNLKFKLGDLDRDANAFLIKKRQDLSNRIDSARYNLKLQEGGVADIKLSIKGIDSRIQMSRECIQIQRDKWNAENERVFDDSSLVCPYCKQEYTDNKKEELKAEFESQKAKQLALITETGNDLKAHIDSDKKERAELENKLQKATEGVLDIQKVIKELEEELKALPTKIDVTETEEYKAIEEELARLEEEAKKTNSVEDRRKELVAEERELNSKLIEMERILASSQKNADIDDRITELMAEQRDVAQRVADQEKMLYLLEEFIRFKMDKVSEDINSVFNGITWKLFSMQINGGMKETCECMVDGVPYGSLNNGHRIVAGLQIIKALQKLYDVQMPIFVDNAESINDFNLPQMESQLILLKVSEDKELSVV